MRDLIELSELSVNTKLKHLDMGIMLEVSSAFDDEKELYYLNDYLGAMRFIDQMRSKALKSVVEQLVGYDKNYRQEHGYSIGWLAEVDQLFKLQEIIKKGLCAMQGRCIYESLSLIDDLEYEFETNIDEHLKQTQAEIEREGAVEFSFFSVAEDKLSFSLKTVSKTFSSQPKGFEKELRELKQSQFENFRDFAFKVNGLERDDARVLPFLKPLESQGQERPTALRYGR